MAAPKNAKDPVGEACEKGIVALGRFFKLCGSGFKKCFTKGENKKKICFGLCLALCVFLWLLRYQFITFLTTFGIAPLIGWFVLFGLLCAPLFCLSAFGRFKQEEVSAQQCTFSAIGFKGKDGQYPWLIGTQQDGRKNIFTYRSTIPLSTWKKSKEILETAMDCTILKMEQGKSKRDVQVITLPSEFKLPEQILWSDEKMPKSDSAIALGEDALGQIKFDLNRTPHVLCAGETGSGKSVILRLILWQMICHGAKIFMFDFKGGVEFSKEYEQYGEVITDRGRAVEVFELLVKENERRLALFREVGAKNLKEYNQKSAQKLVRIGVFVDEIAEMLDLQGASQGDKELIGQLWGSNSTLARLSRATAINLIFGVQRPDAKILPGQIKNNLPVRISGRFADKPASEIVLGTTDAVDLPDIKGRFLFKLGADITEFQAYFFDDDTMLRPVAQPVEAGTLLPELGGQPTRSIVSNAELPEKDPWEDAPTEKAPQKPDNLLSGFNFEFD